VVGGAGHQVETGVGNGLSYLKRRAEPGIVTVQGRVVHQRRLLVDNGDIAAGDLIRQILK